MSAPAAAIPMPANIGPSNNAAGRRAQAKSAPISAHGAGGGSHCAAAPLLLSTVVTLALHAAAGRDPNNPYFGGNHRALAVAQALRASCQGLPVSNNFFSRPAWMVSTPSAA